jgi:hypothetical protein
LPDGVGDDLGLVAVFLTSFLPFTFVNPSVEVVTDQFGFADSVPARCLEQS